LHNSIDKRNKKDRPWAIVLGLFISYTFQMYSTIARVRTEAGFDGNTNITDLWLG